MLSVLNEVQHEHFYEGLGVPAAKAYTRCYDAIVSESRKVYPALEFVGPELGPIKWDKEHTTDFLGYFLDPHNHADGKAPNQISFHCKIDADAFIDLIGLACRLANLKSVTPCRPQSDSVRAADDARRFQPVFPVPRLLAAKRSCGGGEDQAASRAGDWRVSLHTRQLVRLPRLLTTSRA